MGQLTDEREQSGMTYAIRIKEHPNSNSWLFERTFATRNEFSAVNKKCASGRRIGLFESLVIPVRTDNLKNFCQDFFLPTFFNHALRDSHYVGIFFFAAITCFSMDVLTLAIRLVTAIPRYCMNTYQTRQHHPLYQYLKANKADQRLLDTDSVCLKLEYLEDSKFDSNKYRVETEKVLNFIALPKFASSVYVSESRFGLCKKAEESACKQEGIIKYENTRY